MAGNTNFPTGLDDNTSLLDVTDGVTALQAAHHNNLKESIKAIEAKVGINNTAVATALDYRIGHPTFGHRHDGASGQGVLIEAGVGGGGGGTQYFGGHPTYTDAIQFKEPYYQIYAPTGGFSPTAWKNSWMYIGSDGDSSLAGHRYMEFMVNGGNPGGPNDYSKFNFFGGWGLVFPNIATSGIDAGNSDDGQVYYDSVADKLKLWTGATWRSLAME